MQQQTQAHTPLTFSCGKTMKNRFMLAPMTNTQSYEDGRLSDEEYHWLTLRAQGQFGLVMTCASNVQANGQCWPGQLGIYDDRQLPGHKRLAKGIQAHGSLAVVQLHHGGMRSPQDVIGERPVCPSDNEVNDARAMTLAEVEQLRDDFIAAAVRAQKAGYDGVEIHGAHGYILTQFLSREVNQREDQYGGILDDRARLLFEILEGIHGACGEDFLLGVRLSPERFGMEPAEIKKLSQQLVDTGILDFLDLSLWDVFKSFGPDQQPLMAYFADLDRRDVKLTAAGKIKGGEEVRQTLSAGMDFVTIGRSAILHHDFPARVMEEPDFRSVSTPVSVAYLQNEGLSPRFVEYMRAWKGFVADQ